MVYFEGDESHRGTETERNQEIDSILGVGQWAEVDSNPITGEDLSSKSAEEKRDSLAKAKISEYYSSFNIEDLQSIKKYSRIRELIQDLRDSEKKEAAMEELVGYGDDGLIDLESAEESEDEAFMEAARAVNDKIMEPKIRAEVSVIIGAIDKAISEHATVDELSVLVEQAETTKKKARETLSTDVWPSIVNELFEAQTRARKFMEGPAEEEVPIEEPAETGFAYKLTRH